MAAGLGYHSVSFADQGIDFRLSGAGLNLVATLGYAVAPNLIVHGEVFPAFLPIGGGENNIGGRRTRGDATGEMLGVGGGLTYYAMPVNVFVSGSLGLAIAGYEDDLGKSLDLDPGFALNALVGKELHVAGRWGLGVAGQFYYASLPIERAISTVDNVSVVGFSVLLVGALN